jgi:hypothetical protein
VRRRLATPLPTRSGSRLIQPAGSGEWPARQMGQTPCVTCTISGWCSISSRPSRDGPRVAGSFAAIGAVAPWLYLDVRVLLDNEESGFRRGAHPIAYRKPVECGHKSRRIGLL